MDSKINKSVRQEKRQLGTGDKERNTGKESKGKRKQVKINSIFFSIVKPKNKPWEVYISLTFTIIIITTAIIITVTTIRIVQIITIIIKKQ